MSLAVTAMLGAAVGASGPVRTSTVWVEPEAPALFTRALRGQLVDTGWRAERAPDDETGPVRCGLERRADDWVVHLRLRGRAYRRALEGLGRGAAAAEAAALVVRSALEAVDRGEAPVGMAPTPPAPGSGPGPPPWALRLGAGGRIEGWAIETPGAGLDLRLALARGGWSAGLHLGGHRALSAGDDRARIRLRRLEAAAALRRGWPLGTVELFLVGLGGAAGWERSTEGVGSGLVARPSRWVWGALVGLEAGLEVPVAPWALALSAGVSTGGPIPAPVVDGDALPGGPDPVRVHLRLGFAYRAAFGDRRASRPSDAR